MNNEIFLSHLESINQPIESVRKIRESLNQLRDLGFIDDAVLNHIKRDEKLTRNLPLLKSESYSLLTGVKPVYAVGLSTAFFVGVSTLALTNSLIISSALSVGVFYSAFKMRCKWMHDRIEVLAERQKFKTEISKIAVGIKFIDSLEINYSKGVIKQSIFKILNTAEAITAGEVLLLIDDLESAFIYNEEIGYLREQAFDEIYVPEEYRTPDGDILTELDFLTINNTSLSVKNEAEAIEAHFEQLIDRPFKQKDIDEVRLSKTIHETLQDRDNPLIDKDVIDTSSKEEISLKKPAIVNLDSKREHGKEQAIKSDDQNHSGVSTSAAVAAIAAATIASNYELDVEPGITSVTSTDDESSDSLNAAVTDSDVFDALSLGEASTGSDSQSLSELLQSATDLTNEQLDKEDLQSTHSDASEHQSMDHFNFESASEDSSDVTREIDDFNSILDDGLPDMDLDSLDMPDVSLPDDSGSSMSISDLDDLLDGLEEI
ncbi:hypothetical protein LMH73_015850 [Vibrio splendidus]|nr:hypothetical protein [Vibrio splendidus]MCC4881462.1 hypothetical protein [Vibrio splendidus]